MEPTASIAIIKIKELEYSMASAENFGNDTLTNAGFGVGTAFDKEKEEFELQIAFDIKSVDNEKTFVHIKVANRFKIEKMASFMPNDNEINLPDNALITMLSLSISHTRALLARNTSGTPYENFFIPIVNPAEMAKQIFKKP